MVWRLLECPECGDISWTSRDTVKYCGVCAGDNGRDVSMRVLQRRDDRPDDDNPIEDEGAQQEE